MTDALPTALPRLDEHKLKNRETQLVFTAHKALELNNVLTCIIGLLEAQINNIASFMLT